MAKHHLLGPSGYERWGACPGSLIGPAMPDDAGDAAREGTACHALAEWALTTGLDPALMLGRSMTDDKRFVVNQDMVDGARLYINTVRSACLELQIPYDKLQLEKYMSTESIAEELFGGTTDCYAVHDGTLLVVDFKYGRKPVKATSGQLTCYALLAIANQQPDDPPIKRIVQILVQPRSKDGETVTRHEPTHDQLVVVWDTIVRAAQIYLQYRHLPVSPDQFLQTGKHCEYCRRKTTCPAFLRDAAEIFSRAEFPVNVITTDDEVSAALYWIERQPAIEAFFKECKVRLLQAAQQGKKIPGKKLVATYSHREWWSEQKEQVLAALGQYGIPAALATTTEVVSPAQIEKIVKEHVQDPDKRKAVISDINNRLVKRRVTGSTLKDDTAKGDAITPDILTALLELENVSE